MDTLYLLDQGQRRRRYDSFSSSFDNTRIINRSLIPAHQQYQLPSNNQIRFSLQPRQKTVYFITSIWSPIVPCLWKLLQNHKGLHHQNPNVAVPVNNDVGDALIDLVDHSNALPIVIFLFPPLSNAASALEEQGTATKSLASQSFQCAAQTRPVSSHKTSASSPSRSPSLRFLPSFQVEYPVDNVPYRKTTTKQAAPRFIDRLACN